MDINAIFTLLTGLVGGALVQLAMVVIQGYQSKRTADLQQQAQDAQSKLEGARLDIDRGRAGADVQNVIVQTAGQVVGNAQQTANEWRGLYEKMEAKFEMIDGRFCELEAENAALKARLAAQDETIARLTAENQALADLPELIGEFVDIFDRALEAAKECGAAAFSAHEVVVVVDKMRKRRKVVK